MTADALHDSPSATMPERDRPGPNTLRLTFQIKLEDHTTTLLELDNILDFPVPTKATPLALLGEQVKSIFALAVQRPFIAEVNHYVQEKLEATRTGAHEPSPNLPTMNEFKSHFGANRGTEDSSSQSEGGLIFVI